MTYNYLEIIHTTQKALLMKFDKGDCWVPKAMIEEMDEDQVVIYDNFTFKFLPEQTAIEDLFDVFDPEPVVKPKPKKIKKKKVKPFNPNNIDLTVYYTDGSRIDEMPF